MSPAPSALAAALALAACTPLNANVPRADAACAAGRGDCDRDPANGCEADLASDPEHCGACARSCELPHATATCTAGACRVARCAALRGDCDGDATNGCEADLATALDHCGRCDLRCAAAHASAVCASGACAMGACEAGFADCDGDASNGCEADLRASVAHCGACGAPCVAPLHGVASCASGACSSACEPGFERSSDACLPPGAPRLVAPLSTSAVATRRPTLRWALAAGTDGAAVLLCRDRAMASGCRAFDAAGSSLRLPDALPRGSWFWQARGRRGGVTLAAAGAVWGFVVTARDATGDASPARAMDLDGDGYDDLAVGAPLADDGPVADVGAASLYPGGPEGPSPAPSRVMRGAFAGEALGQYLTIAGDLDGDGRADLAVASVWSAHPGAPLPGSVRRLGGPLLTGRAPGFGALLTGAGDVNGDGLGDLALLGAPRAADPLRVYVLFGRETGVSAEPSCVLDGPTPAGLAGAFDLDGDGFGDLLAGAPDDDPGGRMDAGAVRLYLGRATGPERAPARVFAGEAAAERTGASVAALGDVNGDGFEDFAAGAPGADGGAGAVRVFHGAARVGDIAVARVLRGAAGARVARAGDVNGDGHADLAVGAPGADGGLGRVSVHLGGADGVAMTPARTWVGASARAGFGEVVEGVGDVNGDGYDDLAVAERGATTRAGEAGGRVSVFLGGPMGPGVAPTRVLEGAARRDTFGTAVARVGRRPGGAS